MQSYPTPHAAVLTAEGVFYDNGRHVPRSRTLDLSNTAGVLGGAGQLFRGGEGVIIIDHPMPFPSTPDRPELDTQRGDLLREQLAGWKFTELRAWTTFTHEDGTVVHAGWLPDLTEARQLGALLEGHEGPADLAFRLGRYAALVGVPWRYTAGVSGCAALRARFTDPRPGSQPLWRHQLPTGLRGAGPLIWRSQAQPEPGVPRSCTRGTSTPCTWPASKTRRSHGGR
jgi:hypothetical protein